MLEEGYVKMFRQLKHWQHYQKPSVVLVWIDILLSVNTQDAWWHGRKIRRGELFTSVETIHQSTGLDPKTIRKVLDTLEESGEIKREATTAGTKITINHFNKFQGWGISPQPIPQPTPQPIPQPIPQPTPQRLPYKQEYKEGEEGKNLRKKEDDDDNARAKSSVVVGLLDFLRNIYGDFNFTPSQVALVNSKPAEYWDYFMNEIEASKWLKSKDPALALRLHEKVVNGEYRTYEKHEQPAPPPMPVYNPSPEQRQLDELLEEWRTITGRTDDERLAEMERRHPQLPDKFREAIGQCWFRNRWYWKG